MEQGQEPVAESLIRLERALARQNRAYAALMGRLDPRGGAGCLELAGGWAIRAGGMREALAMGLDGPVSAAEIDDLERFMGPGTIQVEILPWTHPTLAALLAQRGYALVDLQQILAIELSGSAAAPPPPPGVTIRPALAEERYRTKLAILQGFAGTDEVPPELAVHLPPGSGDDAEGCTTYAAFLDGELCGGGMLSIYDGVACLAGTGVRAAVRRRGVQTALIHARLEAARAAGCRVAVTNTQAATGSQRNLERAGFRVAYPKAVLSQG